MKIKDTWRKKSSKLRATRIPTSAAKPWSFLCQKMQKCMYNEVPNYSQVSNPKNVSENTIYRPS